MNDFDYVRARSVDHAIALMAAHDEARLLAGGQTLIPTLKQRLLCPILLVDIQDLAELTGIKVTDTTVTIGAMTRHAQVANDADVRAAIPALSHLAGGIADPQVRHMGTIGGSIANNDPAADYPAALVGLGAEVETSRRRVAADDFFVGLFTTALAPDELVLRIHFPRSRRAGYCKFANPASGYVTTGCFVAEFDDGIRVAINGAGPVVFRQAEFERALRAHFSEDAIVGCRQDSNGLNHDMHASAVYRAHLIKVAARRAVAAALSAPNSSPRLMLASSR
jgi:aerobic carbon-monoxide dehydrogenase medium subunit